MAKSRLRLKAREIRRRGESINIIARTLGVSKDSVSRWCEDIELTKKQINTLIGRRENGLKLGQLMGALANKNRKLANVEFYKKEGLRELSTLSRQNFFIAGVALYIAEGSKKNGQIEFINSDPNLICFMLKWLRTFFIEDDTELCFTIFINEIHRSREDILKKYWRETLDAPTVRFRNTVFLKSAQKKVYENHDNYYGTFRVALLKGRLKYYRMMGLIEAFFKAKISST
jgi:hypothetical protein